MSLNLPFFRIVLSLAAFLISGPVLAEDRPSEVVQVHSSFDKTAFSYRIELQGEHDTFRVYRLTYPSPVESTLVQNNTIPAELYMPKGIKPGSKPRPAVICLHILGGGFELTRLQCTALAARGIPAIWFELPYYADRGPPGAIKGAPRTLAAHPDIFCKALSQGVIDVRRTVDVLASMPEVDSQHIGVLGVSLGGVLAGTAAGQEPRITRAVMLLAGGDVLPIIHHAQETRTLSEAILHLPPADRATVEAAIREVDPLQHAPGLRDRALNGRVLMINASEDEVIPRENTEKLAAALGIKDHIVWLEGLGHYTALAALPTALKTAIDFFALDMPPDAKPPRADVMAKTPRQEFVQVLQEGWSFVDRDPAAGHCHLADLEIDVTQKDGKPIHGHLRLVRGSKPKFSIQAQVSGLGDLSVGWNQAAWMGSGKTVFLGDVAPLPQSSDPLALAFSPYVKRLNLVGSIIATLVLAPEILDQWVDVTVSPSAEQSRTIRLTRRDNSRDWLQIVLRDKAAQRLEFEVQGVRGAVVFHAWQLDTPADDALFDLPQGMTVKKVSGLDITRMWAAAFDFAAEMVLSVPSRPNRNTIEVVGRDPAGHGLLCESQGKRVLLVSGSPEEMGTAQGRLLREPVSRLMERVVYGVGAADSIQSGTWWFDRTAEIERRTGKYVPARFIAECDALAAASGVSVRDVHAGNLFPERFHCSGVALCGKATVDGRILHARVLDYMRDIGLQDYACVQVFMPEKKNAWISAGYAGFLGTVTAMNERGLAVGEMGGRGEGQWDGVPMSFLLRDVMERASTVEEALAILRATPRTCEYYYVLSDKSRAMAAVHCLPNEVTVLRPGEQHPLLPLVPEETVLISGGQRAKSLSDRIQKDYGQIDAAKLMEIVKRPVAMNSNLHDAVFSPETSEIWIADAGRKTAACDEPYAHFKLQELLAFYREKIGGRK